MWSNLFEILTSDAIQHDASGMWSLFLKNTWNWAKKTIFWLILRGFWFTPYALWITPQSSAKFNFYGGTYSWQISLVYHLWLWSFKCSDVFVVMQHLWNHPFFFGRGEEVLSPFSPKYETSLLKFCPNVVFNKTKTVSKQSFKIKCLSGNETYPKLKVLIHFWANLPLKNPKYCQKPEFFLKLHPYDY